MSERLDVDICVIGAGSGGLSVAAGASQLGQKVVLCERARMGGDCLNFGCVPSKSVIAAARAADAIRGAERFGVRADPPAVDYAALREHVRGVIAAIEPNDSVERFTGLGVKVIPEHAKFTGQDEVAAGGFTIRARRFVIATGSSAAVPPIPGLAPEHGGDGVPFLTNETVFDLAARPDHLIVIGGGPIGCELAQAHRRLGARVTVIEALPSLLSKDDPELADFVSGACAVTASRSSRIRKCCALKGKPAISQSSSRRAGRSSASPARTCWSPPAGARPSPGSTSRRRA